MQVTLRVHHYPLAKLVRPDFGDSVVAAAHTFRTMFAVDSNLASLPTQRGRTLCISDRVMGTPEGFTASRVLKDLQRVVVTYFGTSRRNRFVNPFLQEQL